MSDSNIDESVLESNVATLKAMGIEDEDNIRDILRQTNNDLQVCVTSD